MHKLSKSSLCTSLFHRTTPRPSRIIHNSLLKWSKSTKKRYLSTKRLNIRCRIITTRQLVTKKRKWLLFRLKFTTKWQRLISLQMSKMFCAKWLRISRQKLQTKFRKRTVSNLPLSISKLLEINLRKTWNCKHLITKAS